MGRSVLSQKAKIKRKQEARNRKKKIQNTNNTGFLAFQRGVEYIVG